MNFKPAVTLVFLVLLCSLSCQESLPVYVEPQNVLSVSLVTFEQVNDHIAPPTSPLVHITIGVQNTFDEVMLDTADIKGSIRIWWKRKPGRYKTLTLTERNMVDRTLIRNGKLMLLPGQRFTLETYWDVKSDDGVFLVSEMNFARARQRYCDFNVICSDPETFVVESSLNVYDRLGYISAPSREEVYVGRACVCRRYPPCSIPPEC